MALIRPRDLIVTFEEDGGVLIRSPSRGKGARAPSWATGVLALCSRPRTRDEVIKSMGPNGGPAYDQLASLGLLVTPEEAEDAPVIFHNYAGVEVHRRMLADEPRITAYREALNALVRPDDVVIDAGSGSGVLAVLAALAGARKVYAIERTDFGEVIKQVAKDSGVADRVEVVRADFGKVVLPEKARLIVTETFGHFALSEGMMPDLAACAARNLAPDGLVIPHATTLYLAPVASAPDLLGPFHARADGVNLSCLRQDAAGKAVDRLVSPSEVGPTQRLCTVPVPNDGTFEADFHLDEPCEALCVWFTLHMAPGVDMLSGPHDPPTHWLQTLLPIALPAGDHHLVASPAPDDARYLLVEINGQECRIR